MTYPQKDSSKILQKKTRRCRFGTLLISLVAAGTLASNTYAETKPSPDVVQLVRPNQKAGITLLNFSASAFTVKSENRGTTLSRIIAIQGTFPRPDWNLLISSKVITRDMFGNFQLILPLGKLKTSILKIEMSAISPSGTIERETLLIKPYATQASKKSNVPAKRWSVSPGVGFSQLGYRSISVPNFSEYAVTAKISATYWIKPGRWDLGFSSYLTVMPLSSNTGDSARFLGVNLRAGYILPFIREPFRIGLYLGGYYTSMFVADNKFGYKHITGPQLYPSARWMINSKSVIATYFKYSPISNQIGILSLSSRELATGVSYSRILPNGHSGSLSFDVSSVALTLTSNTRTFTVQSSSLTLGLGYGF